MAHKNLRIAFGGDLTDQDRDRIVRAAFRHFGMFVIESLAFAYQTAEQVHRLIRADPKIDSDIEEALAAGNGCVVVTAHLGCFELPARYFAARGHEVIVVSRPARDAGTTKMMTELRERQGLHVVLARGIPKALFQGLRRNALVGIVCDQNSTDTRLPFFGRLAGTAIGPARIALRMGSPMFVMVCPRDGHGRYQLEYVGKVDTAPSGETDADIARIMTEVNRLIEIAIRAHPDQWLWFHDRWREPPPDTPAGPTRSSDQGD